MIRRWSWVLAIGLGLGAVPLAATAYAAGEEAPKGGGPEQQKPQQEKVSIEDVPEPARAAIMREAKDGKIDEIQLSTREGRSVYDVKIEPKGGGPQLEIQVSPSGEVVHRTTPAEKKREEQKKEERELQREHQRERQEQRQQQQ